jgi:hypothetical protein
MDFKTGSKLAIFFLFFLPTTLLSQEVPVPPVYPKTTGYISVLHPILTIDKNTSTFNFTYNYTVAFPVGINILKSDKIGFSFELAPFIKADKHSDKVTNFLFHPGIMFRFKHGFTFIARAAFETAGRYGITPVFNKVIMKSKGVNYYLAVPLPVRFGNDHIPSVGAGFQIGANF